MVIHIFPFNCTLFGDTRIKLLYEFDIILGLSEPLIVHKYQIDNQQLIIKREISAPEIRETLFVLVPSTGSPRVATNVCLLFRFT